VHETLPFAAWESFYVIVGSSAAALIGLQFVVIALLTETGKARTVREIDAFATPTIVHFGAVLLLSAVLSAPWREVPSAALALGLTGAAGVAYTALVIRRLRRPHHTSQLVLEDWLWPTILPPPTFVPLLAAAVALPRHAHEAMFVIGGVSLALLFIGIHNAWDTVTYIATDREGGDGPTG
jgi:hypothetical protein